MNNKENSKLEIVDSTGNPFNKNDMNGVNKLKKYIVNNIWNILGIGVGTCITLMGIVNFLASMIYSKDCSQYYGVDIRYFDAPSLIREKIIFLIFAVVLIIYPVFFNYVSRKLKSKLFIILSFIVVTLILFMQNIMYTVDIIDSLQSEWLISVIDNYITVGVFLISDIILAYFWTVRGNFLKEKPLNKLEKMAFVMVFVIFVVDAGIGITTTLNKQISDKKTYEVIDHNKAIITDYEGKFLIMDCELQEKVLYINKGNGARIQIVQVKMRIPYYKFYGTM